MADRKTTGTTGPETAAPVANTLSRRELLSLGGGLAGGAAIGFSLPLLPAELAPLEVLARRYLAWLDTERQLLAAEFFGGFKPNGWALGYEPVSKLIPGDALAWRFHWPADRHWWEVAPPSNRARLVLAAAGVSLGPDDGSGPRPPGEVRGQVRHDMEKLMERPGEEFSIWKKPSAGSARRS